MFVELRCINVFEFFRPFLAPLPKSALARAIEALQPAGRGLALGTGLGLLACSPLVFAQSEAAKQESSLAEVTVSATGMAAGDMATPVQVLGEEELRLRRAATLGETLAAEPGINASHFGAGASRPVIRGMDGARVSVLSDGSELLDASTVSPDHAVTTEPLLARQIEVLRGPSALLYSPGAMGAW